MAQLHLLETKPFGRRAGTERQVTHNNRIITPRANRASPRAPECNPPFLARKARPWRSLGAELGPALAVLGPAAVDNVSKAVGL